MQTDMSLFPCGCGPLLSQISSLSAGIGSRRHVGGAMTAPVHLSALREEQHKNAIGPYQARHRGSLADAPAKIHCVANIAHRSRLGTQTHCNTTVQRFNSDVGDQPSADTDRFRKRAGVVPPSRYLRSA